MSAWCDWCGRAIKKGVFDWYAVKGVERGYDPLLCDANTEDGKHEPAAECDPATTDARSTTDGSPTSNSASAQVGDSPT